ncbi:hypothetical protein D3C86_1609620 [compost metagenome]
MDFASSKARPSDAPFSATSFTSPRCSASGAGNRFPVSTSSSACRVPTMCWSSASPVLGMTPRVTSGSANHAPSSAMTRSQASVSSKPPPTAGPCTAATTIRFSSASRRNSKAGSVRGSACSIQPSRRSSILAPAQNVGPLAAITSARAPCAWLDSMASNMSPTIRRDSALRRCTSFSVMTAMSSRTSRIKVVKVFMVTRKV